MFVSIIIPCFNAALTIGATIESALEQWDVGVEIIVFDDGSTDRSLEIARTFEPRVRVLTGSNQGPSIARNRGIAATAGEWLVFLDADDLLVPGTVRRRLETAEATGADVVVCDWQEFVDRAGRTEDSPIYSLDMTALAADAEVACSTNWAALNALMYRRALVEKIGGFREDLPPIEDPRLLFDAACAGARFAHSPHLGARKRFLRHSLSRRDPELYYRRLLLYGSQIEALWRARSLLSPEQRAKLTFIYNDAARGLFRAADPSFREALATLRASGLPVYSGNRRAELLSDAVGHRRALQVAKCWTKSRRIVATVRLGRQGLHAIH
jgi:glycosyltransferase involved in cell wall biosynthesis